MQRWTKLGIVAGGGSLPIRLAQTCQGAGLPYFVLRLKGFADSALDKFDGADCGLAEIGKLIRMLKEQQCDAITLAGLVARPNFSSLKPDWRGAALLPKAVAAARKGDGAILSLLVETFEAEGFLVIGAEEVASDLLAAPGKLGQFAPEPHDLEDMKKAAALVKAIGPFDVGQGAVVRSGLVVAVEALEGTDAMLDRCTNLMQSSVPTPEKTEREGGGVLLKRPKPGQELRVDLPTIGVRTIEKARQAGLAGIAIEAEAALIMDKTAVANAADEAGIFVFGFQESDFSEY